MKIITKSVHLVDYENGITRTIDPPEAFEEYIVELISHINDNTSVRQFTTISRRTEVISAILDTRFHIDDSEAIQNNSNIIANRLLIKESQAQERIEHLDIQVQKGSLIQALILDETTDNYTYLLAKVEHSGFIDDADFSFKSGFSKDKKTIWKTCIFDLSSTEPNNIPATTVIPHHKDTDLCGRESVHRVLEIMYLSTLWHFWYAFSIKKSGSAKNSSSGIKEI